MADPEHLSILKAGVVTWNLWRTTHPGEIPDLQGANLRGMNLSGARLNSANLSNADLSGSSLVWADLTRASLVLANLSGARLNSANLSNADLSGAELLYADLSEAQLVEAELSGVHVGRTTFGDIDLSSVRGLEAAKHMMPSTIGIDTVFRSRGKIPQEFLRGAGVPEIFITYFPSLITQPIQFYTCFISYSHVDKEFALRLHNRLQERGIRSWLDEAQLLPGDDIYESVDRGIWVWDKVLLCCSKHSLTSWWVDNEINTALEKEMRLLKEQRTKRLVLIPLNLDNYMFTEWRSGKSLVLKSRLAADFAGWNDNTQKFEQAFERLLRALRIDDKQTHLPEQPVIRT